MDDFSEKNFSNNYLQMSEWFWSRDTGVEDLAQLADRVMEVAIPAIVSNVSQPTQKSELDQRSPAFETMNLL